MAFTLRITFSGLCLFVPEAVGGRTTGRMHVLLPGMFGHHHAGADRHIAALSYDAGSLVQGGPMLGVPSLATLSGLALELGSGDTAELGLCGHIPDLKEITGRPVDRDHLGADTRGKLAARVTLGAGRITRVAPGVCWEWRPGEFRPIAHKVEWEIPRVKGDRLAVTATPLGGGGAPRPLGTLFPTNGRLSLEVHHDTSENLPPDPVPVAQQAVPALGEHPRHFSAFYEVFGGPVPTLLPRYRGPRTDCPGIANPCETLEEEMGGTPYTCLAAGVSE
ncbi:MAG TPA: hypothetical protein VHG08_00465 [Longimicrobium sp.]|nr:hypothetical protein [Longimicrobium sp.]